MDYSYLLQARQTFFFVFGLILAAPTPRSTDELIIDQINATNSSVHLLYDYHVFKSQDAFPCHLSVPSAAGRKHCRGYFHRQLPDVVTL